MQVKKINDFIDKRRSATKLFDKYGNTVIYGNTNGIYATLSGELRNLVQAFFKPLKKGSVCEYGGCQENHSLHISHHHSKSRPEIAKGLINEILKVEKNCGVKVFLKEFINRHKDYDSIYILCRKHHQEYDEAVKLGKEEAFLNNCKLAATENPEFH